MERLASEVDLNDFRKNYRAIVMISKHLKELNIPYFVFKISPNGQRLPELQCRVLWPFKVLLTHERP